MAGHGFAPKTEGRRNRAEPSRGDWLDLPARNPARAPKMPTAPRGGWAAGTKLAWKSWHEDPASLMWTPGDKELVRQLAYLHHDLERMADHRGKSSLAGEIRQRCDGLGLTQKGKQDRRWRVILDELATTRQAAADQRSSPYGHLRAVGDAVEGAAT